MAGMTPLHQQWPKAELHLHLEGSVEPETLLELAPHLSLEEIRARYEYEDFLGFLRSYKWVNEHLRGPNDYALITRRLLERLERENVRYAEINLSVGVILWLKQDFRAIYEAVRRESLASPVEVWWLFDAVRQFPVEEAMRVAELAAELQCDGVVGLGIGGDEARGAAELFTDVFRWAREQGLHLVAHAGETGGPQSVWAALKLGAERICHGIQSIADPDLVSHLRERSIPLEISISSNVATGAVPSLSAHPVRRLYDAGVPILLNTDDPAMFHTTLIREYDLAASEFGFSEAELRGIAENGFRHAFRGVSFRK
jgi:aminodeoxyfutalosine deaminase